jgi:hypothetical protein
VADAVIIRHALVQAGEGRGENAEAVFRIRDRSDGGGRARLPAAEIRGAAVFNIPASANPVSHQVMDIPFRVPVGEIVM